MSVYPGSQTLSVLDKVLTSAQNMHCFIPIGYKTRKCKPGNRPYFEYLEYRDVIQQSNRILAGLSYYFCNLKKSLLVYLQVLI